ncbi:hypothetical protein EST38_g7612 [Candolleomyces aberdarensis]|uniref:Uncharacterized protein n=1 Tax=Candolleomyces aberdarensis TaxID=2316362 RepID=A0A4Q2DES9_9AGAR|nr:hypothetical protein EST38_g7612 [Candolleomyces aberdarensis]
MASRPPFYVLVAHHSTSQPPSSNNLRHPAIQYHYADDPPLTVLPEHPGEHVLVLNYDDPVPTAQSVSDSLIVTGLKVEEAPGAAAASAEENDGKNDRMFIIETLRDERPPTPPHEERKSANAILTQFKRRNQMIRDALRYPSDSKLNSTLSEHTVLDA